MHLAYYSWLFTYHRYIIYNYSGVVPKVKPEPENDAKNEGMMLCVEQHAVSAFLWEKISPNLATFVLQKHIAEFIFANAVKGATLPETGGNVKIFASRNGWQKFSWQKLFPVEYFWLYGISHFTISILRYS